MAAEDDDLLSAAGVVLISGALAVAEAADSLGAAGAVIVAGALALTEASDSVSAAGAVAISGALALTEDSDAISAAGQVLVTGTLSVTEEGDSVESFGTALADPAGANYICSLVGGGVHAVVKSIDWSVDSGWGWSADFNQGFDRFHAREKPYSIALKDGLGNPTLTPPPMVAAPREQVADRSIASPGLGNTSGQDRTSNRTRINNQSFATFLASSTSAMISAMANRSGVVINGAPSWWVDKEDIKQLKLADKLRQILDLAAYDLVAELDGTLTCRPWEYEGGALGMTWSTLKGNYNPWEIYTGIRVGKFSSSGNDAEQFYDFDSAGAHQQALSAPLFGPATTDLSSVDGLGAVSYFGADDSIKEFNSFKPLLYQNPYPLTLGLSTKMTVIIDPLYGYLMSGFPSPVRIRVTGTPESTLPLGIDREFLYPPVPPGGGADSSLGDWPCPEEKIDSLWPSQAYAVSRRPYLLAKKNSQADTLTMTRDIIDTSPRLLQRFSWEGRIYKVWSIKWDLAGDTTELTLVRV